MESHLSKNKSFQFVSEDPSCSITNVTHQDLVVDLEKDRYEGIPDMIIFNIACVILLLAFHLLVWSRLPNYLFFKYDLANRFKKNINEMSYDYKERVNEPIFSNLGTSENGKTQSFTQIIFSKMWLHLSKKSMIPLYGEEGYHILRFQRYLILILSIMTACNIGIILPIHVFMGDVQSYRRFESTTLGNLNHESQFLWVHVLLGISYTPLVIYIMRLFALGIPKEKFDRERKRTLMLDTLPKEFNNKIDIEAWFSQKYPWVEIDSIYMTYRTSNFEKMREEEEIIRYTIRHSRFSDKLFKKIRFGGCFYGQGTCPAIPYYKEKLKNLQEDIVKEKERILQEPLDCMFVKLTKIKDVQFILACENIDQIKETKFHVTRAPSKDDIEWSNFQLSYRVTMNEILINLFLFLMFFFFTTPQIVMSNLKDLLTLVMHKTKFNIPSFFETFAPTIFAAIISKLCPVVVLWSSKILGYRQSTTMNKSILRKATIYLLLIILVLPAFGSLSIEGMLQMYWNLFTSEDIPVKNMDRWHCIFLPNSGIFFIDYLITSAFLSNVFMLLRIPDILYMGLNLLWSNSYAEAKARNALDSSKLWMGEDLAYVILNYYLAAVLGLSCPLVTLFGLLYMFSKHMIDSYLLLYTYRPVAKIDHNFYHMSIGFVIGSTTCEQFFTTMFIVIRSLGEEHYLMTEMVAALGLLFWTMILCFEISSKWKWPFRLNIS